MEYVACRVPAAPIRKRSDHKTEMVNQVLFGETMTVLKEKKKWARIRTVLDNYEGWVSLSQLEEINEETAITVSEWTTTDLFNVIDVGANKMNVSFGASLLGWDTNSGKFGKMEYGFSGNKVKRNEIYPDAGRLIKLTHQWLNAPYL